MSLHFTPSPSTVKVSKAKAKIGEGDKDMSLILGNVVNARAVLQTSLTAAKDVASQVPLATM